MSKDYHSNLIKNDCLKIIEHNLESELTKNQLISIVNLGSNSNNFYLLEN